MVIINQNPGVLGTGVPILPTNASYGPVSVYAAETAGPNPFAEAARFDLIDDKLYPNEYPFIPGCNVQKTVVLTRDELRMSDIPQMRGEFARLRRDDLMFIRFADVLDQMRKNDFEIYSNFDYEGDRRCLADALLATGLNVNDEKSVRRTLSKIFRFSGHRLGLLCRFVVVPLIACMRAEVLHLELNTMQGKTAFDADIKCPADALESIKRRSDRNPLPEQDAKRLADAMFFMRKVFYDTEVLFSREDKHLPALCIFKSGFNAELPKDFRQSPSAFIEAQPEARELEKCILENAHHLEYLEAYLFDATRVKRFMLGDVPVVSKRIEPFRVSHIEEEIERALKFDALLDEKGLTDCRTVEYLGLVYDAGNFYILMRDEQKQSVYFSGNRHVQKRFEEVKQVLTSSARPDFDTYNAMHGDGTLVFFDFEDNVMAAEKYNIEPDDPKLAAAALSRVQTADDIVRVRPSWDKFGKHEQTHRRLDNLLKLRETLRSKNPELPTIAAVSDIHSNATRLSALLALPFMTRASATVFLGDYFDRDKDGKRVYEILSSRNRPGDVFLWGNHDVYFLCAMAGHRANFFHWFSNGGLQFIEEFMPLDDFNRAYAEYSPRVSGVDPYKVTKLMLDENSPAVEELYQRVLKSQDLKNIANWLTANGRLSFIDPYGTAYTHWGLPHVVGNDPGYFDWIDERSAWFKISIENDDGVTAEREINSFLARSDLRQEDWLVPLLNRGNAEALFHTMRMGIRGCVYGHTQNFHPSLSIGRYIDIDFGMARSYGNIGGALEVGPNGIVAHVFENSSSDRTVPHVLIGAQEFRNQLIHDVDYMIEGLRQYFLGVSLPR